MLKDNYSAILSDKAPGFTKKRFYLGIIIETIQAISLNFVRYAESLFDYIKGLTAKRGRVFLFMKDRNRPHTAISGWKQVAGFYSEVQRFEV